MNTTAKFIGHACAASRIVGASSALRYRASGTAKRAEISRSSHATRGHRA